jgi:hypothetical protein
VFFNVTHEFDIPLDTLELALLSPELYEQVQGRMRGLELTGQSRHRLEGKTLLRTWGYRFTARFPFGKGNLNRELGAWDDNLSYDRGRHAGEWNLAFRSEASLVPHPARYIEAQGEYRLFPLGAGRSRRIISGRMELKVPIAHGLGERLIVTELRKAYEAEAQTLQDVATLA